jgi:3,8-divinyl chlorophyllide a/chlorophyllide a reductase subunit Z
MGWTQEAREVLDELLEAQPVLVRISAAKRLRDQAERTARAAGAASVAVEHLEGRARQLAAATLAGLT